MGLIKFSDGVGQSQSGLTGGWSARIKTAYANLKIHQKLFWQQYLIVLVFATVSLAGIQSVLAVYDGLLYNESAKALNLSMNNIENGLQQIDNLSLAILSHPEVQQKLLRLNSPLTRLERSQITNALLEILWSYVSERDISSVHLIDNQGRIYSGGPGLNPRWSNDLVKRAVVAGGAAIFTEPLPGETKLICIRQIREIRQLTLFPLGTLVIRIDMQSLIRRSTADRALQEGALLIRKANRLLYTSSPLAQKLQGGLAFPENSRYQIERVEGHRYFISQARSASRDWVYINILPYDRIFGAIELIRKVILVVFGGLLAGALLVSLKTSRSLTRPIANLSAQIKRVENGDFNMDGQVLPEAERMDEIGQLQRDFGIMMQKINTLIQQEYAQQLLLKDTQLRALQTQINPHFLYNTMESINWLAKLNGQHEISRMVEALGNLMRCAMSNRELLITLQREQELLCDYIAIQQMRFGNRLQFRMEVEAQWQHLLIPRLTLQPIVENSIRYGLETVTGVCRIEVTAVSCGRWIEIRVEDNGPGVDPEIMNKLAHGFSQPTGSGIGLQNIAERLRLSFGETCGITIANRPEGGTKVRVWIPGE